jgi:steroid delta-isomerase-like uncharacterized protein
MTNGYCDFRATPARPRHRVMQNPDVIRNLLRTQIELVWGKGEVERVDSAYGDTVVDRMPIPGQPGGREALKDVVRAFRTAMPDLNMQLHGVLAAGDIGVDFWTLTGTHSGELFGIAPTGKQVEFSGIDMVRVAGGRIAELWHVEEMLQFYTQLGVMPPAAFGAPTVGFASAPADYDPGANAAVAAASDERSRRNLGVARWHIEELWGKGRTALAAEIYAPDVVDHMPAPGQRPGVAGIVDVLGWLRESVPDVRLDIRQYVVDGDFAADRWVMRGTHTGAPLLGLPAKGKAFEINGMDVIRIHDDGRITDVWHAEEFERLRHQIA